MKYRHKFYLTKGILMKPSFTRTRIIVLLFTLCAVGIFAIAGTWYVNVQKTKNTQVAANITPTPTQLIQQTPPPDSCGTVNARQGEPTVVFNGQDATTAEACFWQAYQQCQTKTLAFHLMGVDTGTTHTLWPIKENGTCHIADQVSNFSMIPQGNHSSFITCAKLQNTQQGLLLSECGTNPDLTVPAPTP